MAISQMEIGRAVRAGRILRGLSAPQLAAQLGWKKWKIYRIENGDTKPTFTEIVQIAEVLKVPLEFFRNPLDQGTPYRMTIEERVA